MQFVTVAMGCLCNKEPEPETNLGIETNLEVELQGTSADIPVWLLGECNAISRIMKSGEERCQEMLSNTNTQTNTTTHFLTTIQDDEEDISVIQ